MEIRELQPLTSAGSNYTTFDESNTGIEDRLTTGASAGTRADASAETAAETAAESAGINAQTAGNALNAQTAGNASNGFDLKTNGDDDAGDDDEASLLPVGEPKEEEEEEADSLVPSKIGDVGKEISTNATLFHFMKGFVLPFAV